MTNPQLLGSHRHGEYRLVSGTAANPPRHSLPQSSKSRIGWGAAPRHPTGEMRKPEHTEETQPPEVSAVGNGTLEETVHPTCGPPDPFGHHLSAEFRTQHSSSWCRAPGGLSALLEYPSLPPDISSDATFQEALATMLIAHHVALPLGLPPCNSSNLTFMGVTAYVLLSALQSESSKDRDVLSARLTVLTPSPQETQEIFVGKMNSQEHRAPT